MGKQQSNLLRALGTIDWQAVLLIIGFGIAVGVVQHKAPAVRPVFAADAAIAYSYMGESELPFWVALLVPFLLLLATAIVVELWLNSTASMAQRTLLFINVLLGCLAALAVVAFMTELFKRICGRLRPDFLDRCQPLELTDTAIPFGTFPRVVCKRKEASVVLDGHLSFPSGHSSCSMAIALYAVLYQVSSCLFGRISSAQGAALASPAASLAGRLVRELCSLGLLLLVLFELTWPWGVAASRFMDNRHNVSDVVAGLLLGVTFTPLFVLRLVTSQQRLGSKGPAARHVLPVTAEDADVVHGRHRADNEGSDLVSPPAL